MGREDLGPGVREVVDAAEDSQKTINLWDLAPGNQLIVKIGDQPENLLDFTIITPAKKRCDNLKNSARAFLPGWKWSKKCTEKNVEILIGGSCTYNPGSPLGMTMLTIGSLTVGRNMVIWLDETDQAMIFKAPIKEIILRETR